MRLSIHHYAIFLFSALLPWTFFSQSLTYAVDSIVGNGALLKKVHIAKSVFPIAAVLSNVINFLLSLAPLSLLLLVFKFPFHWTWVYLPVPLLALVVFSLGCAFFCATANVFFRDVTHIIQIVLSAWFYFSPVLYSLELMPPKYHWLFRLNPLLYILNGFRLAIYQGVLPSAKSVAMSLICAIAALMIGSGVFRRYQSSFIFYV
jgi:ABC-type polysaccharide/polyol phosphate export permease